LGKSREDLYEKSFYPLTRNTTIAMTEEIEEKKEILEFAVSVQRAGSDRGKRIYFDTRDIEEIKEKCGEDFFLLNDRTLIAFVDPEDSKITITPLKGIYKKTL